MKKVLFVLMMAISASLFCSCDELVNNVFQKGIEEAKKDLPTQLDEGMVMDDITLGDNGIVYHVTVSEEVYDMDALKEVAPEMKKEMIKGMEESIHDDQDMKDFLEAAVELNKPVNYKYEGDTSGSVVRIKISVNELKEILGNKE